MGKWIKFRLKLLSGRADQNIDFNDLQGYLHHLGFENRQRGSHQIFFRSDVIEIINLQPADGGKAKANQEASAKLVLQYKLGDNDA